MVGARATHPHVLACPLRLLPRALRRNRLGARARCCPALSPALPDPAPARARQKPVEAVDTRRPETGKPPKCLRAARPSAARARRARVPPSARQSARQT
jgi:hypothetical protein